jgi:hypothetical protein
MAGAPARGSTRYRARASSAGRAGQVEGPVRSQQAREILTWKTGPMTLLGGAPRR